MVKWEDTIIGKVTGGLETHFKRHSAVRSLTTADPPGSKYVRHRPPVGTILRQVRQQEQRLIGLSKNCMIIVK